MTSGPYDADTPRAGARGRGAPGRLLPNRLAAVAAGLAVVGILSAFVVVGGLLGLVLGALTVVFVAVGVIALVLGFRGLGATGGGVGGRGMALAAIVGGAFALLLALLLVLLVALPVGAFFTRYSDELSDLDRCLKGAADDQTKILACQDDFARKIKP